MDNETVHVVYWRRGEIFGMEVFRKPGKAEKFFVDNVLITNPDIDRHNDLPHRIDEGYYVVEGEEVVKFSTEIIEGDGEIKPVFSEGKLVS